MVISLILLFREGLLQRIPEVDSLEGAKSIIQDPLEPLMKQEPIPTGLAAGIKGDHYQGSEYPALSPSEPSPPEATPEVAKLVAGNLVNQRSALATSGPSPIPHPQPKAPEPASTETGLEIERGSSPELIIAAPLPPVDMSLSATKSLEDLPALPLNGPSSRPDTPKTTVDPSNEPTLLKFPESRSNKKVDVKHLHLPSDIPRDPSSDGDLPLLSPDPTADSEYAGGVSLQSRSATSHSNDANAPRLAGNPEDEGESLSSFGDGTIQAIPVAQVGLGNPMFPGTSRSGGFLGTTDSPTQRFFPGLSGPVDIDEFEELAHDPTVSEKDNERGSVPSIEVNAPVEEGSENGEKGEEGRNPLSWIARQFKS